MSKKLERLTQERMQMLVRQGQAASEILANCVRPEEAAESINEIIYTSSRHRELLTAIDNEMERCKKSWWERLLS